MIVQKTNHQQEGSDAIYDIDATLSLLLVDESGYGRLFYNEFICENTVLILHLHVIDACSQ